MLKHSTITINGKTFNVKEIRFGTVLITSVLSISDIIFFYNWYKVATSGAYASDYKKEIDYDYIISSGKFVGCYPIVDELKNRILISYDAKKINDAVVSH